MKIEFELRPGRESDREPLYALHCATMRDVITRTWGWDEAWQRDHFDGRFDPSKVSVVSVGGRDVGAHVAGRPRPGEIYVAELQIAPEMQGRGLGSAVLSGVVAAAAARGACVTLQVLDLNVRARRLYERLGFYATGDTARHVTDRHVQMRHDAGAPPARSALLEQPLQAHPGVVQLGARRGRPACGRPRRARGGRRPPCPGAPRARRAGRGQLARRRSSRVVTIMREGVSEKSSTSGAQRRPAGRSGRPGPASSPREAALGQRHRQAAVADGRARSGGRRCAAASARSACSRFSASRSSRGGRPATRPCTTFSSSLPPEVVAGVAQQVDRVALGRERPARARASASSSRPTTPDHRRRVDGAAVGLVVERDVAAGDGHAQRAAGVADAARWRARAGP